VVGPAPLAAAARRLAAARCGDRRRGRHGRLEGLEGHRRGLCLYRRLGQRFRRDGAFAANLEEARAARLQLGAVHRYDPCQPAERQAGNFVTVVPRDSAMLPPAVDLDLLADACPIKVGDAAVLSELTTFLNQIETHTGKAAILKLSGKFEARYHVAAAIDRNLWLVRTRFQPDYAGRPWMLWTANLALANPAGQTPLRWVVVQR
jgi:lysozyme